MTQIFSPAKLKTIRTAAGVSRMQLAMATGRNFHQVGSWERGRDVPNTTSLFAICEYLGCKPGDLFEHFAAAGEPVTQRMTTAKPRRERARRAQAVAAEPARSRKGRK